MSAMPSIAARAAISSSSRRRSSTRRWRASAFTCRARGAPAAWCRRRHTMPAALPVPRLPSIRPSTSRRRGTTGRGSVATQRRGPSTSSRQRLRVVQGPFRDVALAGVEDALMLLGIVQALPDGRNERRAACHMRMQGEVDPFLTAALAFAIEFVERILEAFPEDARRVSREEPHGDVVGRHVGARQHDEGSVLGVLDEGDIVAGVVADPDVALLAQELDGLVRAAAAGAGPADRTDARGGGQHLGAADDLVAFDIGSLILGIEIVGPAMAQDLVTLVGN